MSFVKQLEEAEDQSCLELVVQYYSDSLMSNEKAQQFLESRKLNHPEVLKQYHIGFCDRTLGTQIPKTHYKAGRIIRDKLKRIGITKGNGIEVHRGGLVVPNMDIEGNVVDIFSYKISSKLRPDTHREIFCNSGIFNAQTLKSAPEIILVGVMLDALSFLVHGYPNVTCIFEDNDPTQYFEFFKTIGCKRLLVVPEIFQRIREFVPSDTEIYEVAVPHGYSINDYCLAVPNAQEALGQLIRHAQWQSPISHKDDSGILSEDASLEEGDEEAILENLDLDDCLNELEEEIETLQPLPAVRTPEPPPEQSIKEEAHQIVIQFSDRTYRIRGLYTNTSHHRLKVSLFASVDDKIHIDDLNLYQSRSRAVFIIQSSAELGLSEKVVKSDIGRLVFILEECLHKKLQSDVAIHSNEPVDALTSTERSAAIEYLKQPNLISNILQDLNTLDVIGQEQNVLVCYLAVTSRFLDDPIAITIQSASASGKTSLMNGVLQLIPEDHKVSFSSITSQSLYYMEESGLKHKILAIAELDGVNKGSSAYSLKLLQSEKEISIATTLKDEKGNLRTMEKRVEGPVQFFCTTTRIDVDDELLNRTLVVSISDDPGVTEAIHKVQRQRQTLAGIKGKKIRQRIIEQHHRIQQCLKSVVIVNPYAPQLTFFTGKTRTRRDHQKYLSLIKAITFLHQYQRPVKTIDIDGETVEYIESTVEDIKLANQIAYQVLGNCLLEDLPPQTQQLLLKIHAFVSLQSHQQNIPQSHYRFTRSDIRAYSGWSISQLKVHCQRLEELEYLVRHKGGRGKVIEYQLLWNGEGLEGDSFAMGLLDIHKSEAELT
ncbi:MAG: hypothetical protein K6L76_02955 [Agarilytica sp.]